jgi:hypothetical protein
LKLLEERIGKTLQDTGIGKDFLNRTLIAYEIRTRIEEWDCVRLKSFCTSKERIIKETA